jgi:Uma2 family endonuclease
MPTIATMSGAQFDALPYEEGRRWEPLEGELIGVPGATPRHQDIVFARCTDYRAPYADVEFALANSVRLHPDVCLLLPERVRQLDPDRIPIPGAPDLPIEVICSPAFPCPSLPSSSRRTFQNAPQSRNPQAVSQGSGQRSAERL